MMLMALLLLSMVLQNSFSDLNATFRVCIIDIKDALLADRDMHENHVSEHVTAVSDDVDGEEVDNPETGEVLVKEEEAKEEEEPVTEVVDEIPDDKQMVDESNSKTEKVPKKSYASIVSSYHAVSTVNL